jgi:hypothetical protein
LSNERLGSVEIKVQCVHDKVDDNAAASADTSCAMNKNALLLVQQLLQ